MNLLVKTAGSSDALITRFNPPFLDVFKASENTENIFKEGMSVKLSGHYCNEVIKNDKKVMIVNALENKKWKDSIDAQSGFNAYLGYPLKWPNGKMFGTICIHHKKSHNFSEQTQEIMFEFKELIESQLEVIYKNIEIEKEKEIVKEKDKKYENLVEKAPIGIFETTAKGRIISINKSMAEILDFSNIEETLAHYNNLKTSLYLNPKRREEFIKILNNKGKVKNFEYEAIGKNKEHKWISMNARKENKIEEKDFLIEGFAFDVTKRKNREEKIIEQKEELSASYEQITAYNEEITAINEELEGSFKEIEDLNNRFQKMISLISNIDDLNTISEAEFLSEILQQSVEIIPEADFGSVYTFGENHANFIDCIGYDLESLKKIEIPNEAFYNEDSVIDIINIEEIEKRNRKYMSSDSFEELADISLDMHKEIMTFILIINGVKKAGISLDIKKESRKSFTNRSKKLFSAFYNIVSSFYKMKEYNSLQNNFTKELVSSTVKMLEMYDLYTRGHSENVADLAVEIAEEMKLEQKRINDIYWAGLVHDIGKLLIPLEVLNKEGELSDSEYELIKEHPILGGNALKSSNSLKHIAKYVRHHHERWDGDGYPDNLQKNNIPLESQILCAADAWDAMTSKRTYRKPLSCDHALREIKDNKGIQFSPVVVESLLNIIED